MLHRINDDGSFLFCPEFRSRPKSSRWKTVWCGVNLFPTFAIEMVEMVHAHQLVKAGSISDTSLMARF